jgi:hypothetical protein
MRNDMRFEVLAAVNIKGTSHNIAKILRNSKELQLE